MLCPPLLCQLPLCPSSAALEYNSVLILTTKGIIMSIGDFSIPVLVVLVIFVLYLINCIKILREYERAVIFTLGRLGPAPKGPGIIFVFRPFQQMIRISLRQDVLEVPPQDVITRDNVTIKVNAVVTFYVVDPNLAAIKVTNYLYQTSQMAQTTLRTVLGEAELDELLSHRDKLNLRVQSIIDQRTEPFGVKVVSMEVKQVDLPDTMQRAMAKQAEAEREKRSKIIHAEGEYNAAQKLVDAAAVLAEQPITLQLRYLQTLTEIGVEKNTTIIFPLPVELLSLLNKVAAPAASKVEKV
jgi:regulator of protease activity HflC (stomatin/prohibitin superfamily)